MCLPSWQVAKCHELLHAWFSQYLSILSHCGNTWHTCYFPCLPVYLYWCDNVRKESIAPMSIMGRMIYARLLTPPMFQAFARVVCASASVLSINILPFTASISSPFTMPPGEKSNMEYIHVSNKNSVSHFCSISMQYSLWWKVSPVHVKSYTKKLRETREFWE